MQELLGEYPKFNIRLFRVKSVCTVIFGCGQLGESEQYWRNSIGAGGQIALGGGGFSILSPEFSGQIGS